MLLSSIIFLLALFAFSATADGQNRPIVKTIIGEIPQGAAKDCQADRKKIEECRNRFDISLQWDRDEFDVDIQNHKNLLTCIGDLSCRTEQLKIKIVDNSFQLAVTFHKELRGCMSAKFVSDLFEKCNVIACQVHKAQKCLETSARNVGCSEQDVKKFTSIVVAALAKDCNLKREQKVMEDIYKRIEKLEAETEIACSKKTNTISVPVGSSLDA